METSVVYLTTYEGTKHPPFYIGSTSLKRFENGYKGSPRSKEWSEIFKTEVRDYPHLYHCEILSIHETREEALQYEKTWQESLDAVKSPLYLNKTIAIQNGAFGQDVSGSKNPMYGKDVSDYRKESTSLSNTGKVIAFSKELGKFVRIDSEVYRENKDIYYAPGPVNPNAAQQVRERVSSGTHHFLNPEVQRRIHEKRIYFISDAQKVLLRKSMLGRYKAWEAGKIQGNQNWKYCIELFEIIKPFLSLTRISKDIKNEIKSNIKQILPLLIISDKWLEKIITRFKNGWNPCTDVDFLKWIENENK